MALTDEKYVLLTTYRKNGEPKPVPVWIVDLGDGTMGFTTQGDSWKCKRIRNDPRVTLQPCDARGNVRAGTEAVSGTAEIGAAADYDRVRALIEKKYGFMVRVIGAIHSIRRLFAKGGENDTAVIITLDTTDT